MQTRNKTLNTRSNSESFQTPSRSPKFLLIEIHHKRENNIQEPEIDQEKILTRTDPDYQEHRTDTLQTTRTPKTIHRIIVLTPSQTDTTNERNLTD